MCDVYGRCIELLTLWVITLGGMIVEDERNRNANFWFFLFFFYLFDFDPCFQIWVWDDMNSWLLIINLLLSTMFCLFSKASCCSLSNNTWTAVKVLCPDALTYGSSWMAKFEYPLASVMAVSAYQQDGVWLLRCTRLRRHAWWWMMSLWVDGVCGKEWMFM